jgi:hypothetical protein
MADLKRRNESLRTQLEQAHAECALLRSVVGWIDPAYAQALIDAADLALLGIRRPDDLGGTITTSSSSTRTPSYTPKAYDILRKQRVVQRREAEKIRRRIRWIVDQDSDPEDSSEAPLSVPGTPTPLRRSPSQNGNSPTRPYASVSLGFRRAPIGAPEADTA